MSLEEVLEKRGTVTPGYNPHRFAELYGASMVPIMNYEPDAQTFRNEYYYNSRHNRLYKKLMRTGRQTQYFWKPVSSIDEAPQVQASQIAGI